MAYKNKSGSEHSVHTQHELLPLIITNCIRQTKSESKIYIIYSNISCIKVVSECNYSNADRNSGVSVLLENNTIKNNLMVDKGSFSCNLCIK